MLRIEEKQLKMFCGSIEDLMPKEHFLRDLEKYVNFGFVYDKVKDLYSNKGRPSIDPVTIIKMLLIGYLYGINSERKLEQEIKINIAYMWFLGLELEDAVPDHSTISQLRRRKFKDTTIFQEIFDEVGRKCMEVGLVSGKMLLTDSTHIRANARNDRCEIIEVPDTPSEYMKKLDKEALEIGLIEEAVTYSTNKTKLVTKSTTDPECGMLNRTGKPKGFYYLSHQTCDAANGIITDVLVTPANVNDCAVHTVRLEEQIEKFGFETESICADAGYDSSEVYEAMLKRGIKTYIPKKSKPTGKANYKNDFCPERFDYDSKQNFYICPAGKELHYSCYNKKNRVKRYQAKKYDCLCCRFKQWCIGKSSNPRQIERNMHEEARQIQFKNINTPTYKIAMKLRRIWCEGNFAHQKELHNLSGTKKRGIKNLTEQCLLSACALNLKRLVMYLKESVFFFDPLQFFAVQFHLNSLFLCLFLFLSTAPRMDTTRTKTKQQKSISWPKAVSQRFPPAIQQPKCWCRKRSKC